MEAKRNIVRSRVLLQRDRKSIMRDMREEKRCPRCGAKEKVKNGYNKGKQRYLCKECGRNYTGTKTDMKHII